MLTGAIELSDDRVGNDNGLCQSGEQCVLMSNIGAYQGDQWYDDVRANLAMQPAPTPTYDGVNISGVSLWTTPTNGSCSSGLVFP